jgi:DNA-binding NarL/FixJ family response regulator
MRVHAHLMIVADHPLYIEGFQSVLARHAPAMRCSAARTPAQAMDRLKAADCPDLVVVDYQLFGAMNGLTLLQKIGASRPGIARVLMSSAEESTLSLQARRASLSGFLSHSMEPVQWVQALEDILRGGQFFAAQAPDVASLNERQVTVLQLASVGLCNRQIASRLHLTERTVKYHFSESFRRLATSSRTEAVAKAAALGLIRLISLR